VKLDTFEFRIFKKLKSQAQQTYLLGVSGGMDSMVLLHAFWRIAQKTPLEFAVAHVHHGTGAQKVYRDKVSRFVRTQCEKYGVALLSAESNESLKSEAELREFRFGVFRNLPYDKIVLAHHRDDLLETRLIRLIRGTGPQGLVSMRPDAGDIFRPMLEFSRRELHTYAKKHKLKWCEDPSNKDEKYLRNWVRRSWLPSLEKRRAGAVEALSRSLELLAQAPRDHVPLVEELDRNSFADLDVAKKQQMLASFLRQKKITNYSLNHINEVIKRLNTRRKYFEFVVAKVKWQVNDRHFRMASH
jgi:tRNA(Ile)-lysidine synthase